MKSSARFHYYWRVKWPYNEQRDHIDVLSLNANRLPLSPQPKHPSESPIPAFCRTPVFEIWTRILRSLIRTLLRASFAVLASRGLSKCTG